jgi:hypothetical protein
MYVSCGCGSYRALTWKYHITRRSKFAVPIPEVNRMASELARHRRFPWRSDSSVGPYGLEDFAVEVSFVKGVRFDSKSPDNVGVITELVVPASTSEPFPV